VAWISLSLSLFFFSVLSKPVGPVTGFPFRVARRRQMDTHLRKERRKEIVQQMTRVTKTKTTFTLFSLQLTFCLASYVQGAA
jgi:hypothetical protein